MLSMLSWIWIWRLKDRPPLLQDQLFAWPKKMRRNMLKFCPLSRRPAVQRRNKIFWKKSLLKKKQLYNVLISTSSNFFLSMCPIKKSIFQCTKKKRGILHFFLFLKTTNSSCLSSTNIFLCVLILSVFHHPIWEREKARCKRHCHF